MADCTARTIVNVGLVAGFVTRGQYRVETEQKSGEGAIERGVDYEPGGETGKFSVKREPFPGSLST